MLALLICLQSIFRSANEIIQRNTPKNFKAALSTLRLNKIFLCEICAFKVRKDSDSALISLKYLIKNGQICFKILIR